MEVRELRIGNYIQGIVMDKVTTIKVSSIEMDGVIIHGRELPDKFTIIGNLADKWEPIQLTYDWLEKFRFIRFRESKCYFKIYIFNREDRKLNIEGDVGFSVSVEYEDKFAMISFIQYVHQLQNLYFALTGEELVLKTD